MANVRDSDTSLWLHNKLGTSNDTWIGESICSQLSAAVLGNIRECYEELQTQVKLKLLLTFLHIPRRYIEEVSLREKGTCPCRSLALFTTLEHISPLSPPPPNRFGKVTPVPV